MSEESEEEERRLLAESQGLGDLPDGVQQDPGRQTWPRRPDPGSEEAIDLISEQQLRVDRAIRIPDPRRTIDELNAEQDSIHLEAKVTSVYNARPVNGFDTLFGGEIRVAVQGSCTLLSVDPGPPYTDDINCYPNGNFTLTNQTITGCVANTYHGENCIAATSLKWQLRDVSATSPGLYNAYLFNTAGVLIQSLFDFAMPAVTTDIFTILSPASGDEFTFAVTGNAFNVTSSNLVEVIVNRVP